MGSHSSGAAVDRARVSPSGDYSSCSLHQPRTLINIGVYRDFLRSVEDRKELLGMEFYDRRRDQDVQVPILRTWQLSFGLIQKQRPRAIQILSTMAVIDREGIPESILLRDGESKISLRSALAILQSFSLITAEKQDTTFRMHRLVQIST